MNTVIHINGKWLSQTMTGTQRYANEIVKAIVSCDRLDVVVHVPADAVPPKWMSHRRVEIRRSRFKGIAFEQIYLPIATYGELLVNLAGPAPLVKRRQLVTMHDATTFRHPQTFRISFVAFYYAMYGLLGRTADHLVTVSEFSARELADVLSISVDRFVVVPCAADTLHQVTPVRPALELEDKHYLVVGTPAQHKNLAMPVAAMAKSGRQVVVVGVSDRQVFSAASSLDDDALLAGRLTDEELAWMYRNAAALVFPSKYEGFGLPPLEAQLLGCPVVCSAAASMPEVCGDGALYFDPEDTATLLAQLDRIDTEHGLADDMRNRGIRNARRFTWDASAGRIIGLLTAYDAACAYLPSRPN
jgi:glycosyltransferase involved in cell wall biosynthesis